MVKQCPTVLVYGFPNTGADLFAKIRALGWGLVIDDGNARDPVFTINENFARADAVIAFPNANPIHLSSLLAEAEVGHPLITTLVSQSADDGVPPAIALKPIIFFGSTDDWSEFQGLFAEMIKQGLIRKSMDQIVTFSDSADDALARIKPRLSSKLDPTRIVFYQHSRTPADVKFDIEEDLRPESALTVACIGSASTKSDEHLGRARNMARFLARNNFNILHGGGDKGVMGALSVEGKAKNAHVIGITVDIKGAPKIFFEKDNQSRPDSIAELVISKDMIHRIESYAGNSQCFVALDGGIGSIQEIVILAELRREHHPVVTYKTENGTTSRHPVFVLNESGIYNSLLAYLNRNWPDLAAEINNFDSIDTLQAAILAHYKENPPVRIDRPARQSFRELKYVGFQS